MAGKYRFRKPDPLLLVMVLVGFGLFATTAATAGDELFAGIELFNTAQLSDLMDGEVALAQDRYRGNGLYMNMFSEPVSPTGNPLQEPHAGQTMTDSVRLSVRIPW